MTNVTRLRAAVAALAAVASVVASTAAVSAVQDQRAPIAQTASLEVPAAVQVGQKVTLRATFAPARKGRKVVLQVKQGRRWRTVDAARQDGRGRVSFAMAARRTGTVTVRASAARHQGLSAVRSKPRRIKVQRERVAIAESFHALTSAEARLATYDPATGRLSFRRAATKAISSLAAGDFLTVPPTDAAPSGALVEVERVRRRGRAVVASTSSASLTDVVLNVPDGATAFAPTEMAPPEVLWTAPGVDVQLRDRPAAVAGARLETLEGTTVEVSLSHALPPNDLGTVVAQQGALSFTPLAELELDSDWGDLKSYKLGVGGGVNLQHEVSVGGALTADQTLARLNLTFRALIGWLPVYITAQADLVVSASIGGKVVLRLVASGELVVGVEGDEDSESGLFPDPYADVPDTELSLQPGLVVNGEVGPRIEAEISVYGMGGPVLETGLMGGVEREDFGGAPQCSSYVRADAGIGAATSDFFEKLIGRDYETGLRTLSIALKDQELSCGVAPTESPTATPTGTPTGTPTASPTATPTPDPLRVVTSFLPRAYQRDPYGSLFVASVPDGQWRVTSGALPPGIELDPDGHLTGTPTGTPGTSTFTIEVRTPDGRTASRELQLVVEPVATWSSIGISDGWLGMACGLGNAGQASCWWHPLFFNPREGDGSSLRGNGNSTIPGPFVSLDGTCGLRGNGSATCWTNARYTDDFNETIDVRDVPGTWRQVVGGTDIGCGVREDGSAGCWTIPFNRFTGPPTGELPGTWTRVTLDDGLVCGLRPDGSGACFPDALDAPVEVGGSWVASRVGRCGLAVDGTAWCLYGPELEPNTDMPGPWAAISTWNCGIRPDGDLECVGGGSDWDFTREGPWTAVSGTCALRSDGTGWCWGDNGAGEVGNGSRDLATAPVQLPGRWKQLVSRGGLSCGLQLDDTGWCWGASPVRVQQPWHPPVRLVPTPVRSGH